MLKLRLQRRGKKNYATYRVVVAEQHAPVKGRFLADVGSYNPHTNTLAVDKDAVTQWLTQGVQPSATVHNLLVTQGLLAAEKVTVWRPPQPEARPEATQATEEAAEKAITPEQSQDTAAVSAGEPHDAPEQPKNK